MSEFPNNPEDVSDRMSTAGDEWTSDGPDYLAGRLNDVGVALRNGKLFYERRDGTLDVLGAVDFEELGINGIKYYDHKQPFTGFVNEYSDDVMTIVYDAYTEAIWDDREEGWVEMGGL